MNWYYIILISALFVTLKDIITKKVLIKEHATETLLATYLGSLVLMVFLLPFITFNYEPRLYLLIILRSFFTVSALILFYKALRHSDLSVVAPFMNLSPIFLIGLSYFFLGERLTFIELFGVLLLIAGSFFLKNEETSVSDHKTFVKSKFFMYMILSLLFISISAMFAKYISPFMKPHDMLFFALCSGLLLLLLYQSIMYKGVFDLAKVLKNDFYSVFGSGLLSILHGLTYFFVLSLPDVKVSLVIPILRFSILLDIIIGGALLKEKHLVRRLAACSVMLLGVFVILI